MEIFLDNHRDSANSGYPGKSMICGNANTIQINLDNPKRTIEFDTDELRKIMNLLAPEMIPCTHASQCKDGVHPASWG